MSRWLKRVALVGGVIAALVLILFGAWSWYARRAFPKVSGEIKVSGIQDPVEIIRDEYGVAHLYGRHSEDLFFAQGYVHAQERFWQMEFQRRTGAGRLSEIFGEATLSIDRHLRHFNFVELSERSYEMLTREERGVVDAYAAGVNAYLEERSPARLGLEFALLGLQGVDVEIEPWTTADSLIWSYMMMYNQANQYNVELTRLDQLVAVGQEMYDILLPDYRDSRPTVIPSSELASAQADNVATAALPADALAFISQFTDSQNELEGFKNQLAELGLGQSAGSNSIAISGELSETGMPILANDPHMPITIPSLWYEMGLHCVEKSEACPYDMRGFSFPGVPVILIGHNDRIAWALTNAAFDPEDVFVERLNPADPNQYEVNGQWVDMEMRREEINVRGREEPDTLLVRKTRNGIIITDNMIDRKLSTGPDLFALSYRWTALEPVRSLQAVGRVNKAQNWDEFVEALRLFDAGQQNWLFADVEGNIGYVLPGQIPIRAAGDGTLPVPGWNDDYQWTGFIPYEEMPRVFNPEQGFIVTANNPQVREEDYPYLIGRYHDRGQRAERLTQLILEDTDGISIADVQRFQTDNGNLSAREVIPFLQPLSFDDPALTAARDRLLRWDANMVQESSGALLFNIFFRHLVAETYNDQLPADRPQNVGTIASESVYVILQDADNDWWDDIGTPNVRERRQAIMTRAFESAYEEGVELFGEDLDEWSWGEVHTISFVNATLGQSGISLIEGLFNRGPFPVHGSESVPQKTCWNANASNPYQATCLPALRMVVDLSDLSNSQMIHSVGQSGHPMHRHYDDFIERWRNLEYHPTNWDRVDVEAGDHDLLTLTPN